MVRNYEVETIARGYLERIRCLAIQIRPGMTRQQVDRMFPECHGGIIGTYITIYPQARGAKVEVPFDALGGPCSLKNRVNGDSKVFIELVGNRWGIEFQK